MSYTWHDVLGNIGVVLVLVIYLLLQMEKLSASNPLFSAFNAVGAVLILVSLSQDFNLSAFLIEAVWFVVSIYGLLRYRKYRKPVIGENH
jgi:uncharacterized membrane protein YfcA